MAHVIASVTLKASRNTPAQPRLVCEYCAEDIREGDLFELVLDDHHLRSIWCTQHRDKRED